MASLLVSIGFGLTRAHAEVRLEGDSVRMRLEAHGAPVAQVLSELSDKLNLRYRLLNPSQATIDGIFSGSLEAVLGQVLTRFNYIVKKEDQGIEIIVIGQRGDRAIPAQPLSQSPIGPAAEWRAKLYTKP
jgi:hypothetical protein